MRPKGPCARCLRDLTPDCEHLANAYDHYALKTRGTVDLDEIDTIQVIQELAEYGLNRMLALDRDNGNKAAGLQASRVYHSRNLAVSGALANKCHVRRGAVQCMRNAGHAGEHKF